MALGAFPSQCIERMIADGEIAGGDVARIQPSSLDLTISDEIYKMKGVFLPRAGESIGDLLQEGSLFPWDLGKPLECQGIYLIRLRETLALRPTVYARTNNKSSTGRVNLQARVLADGVPRFDALPRGYHGNLWLLVIPRSFSVKLSAGDALNQIRFFNAESTLTRTDLEALYADDALLHTENGIHIAREHVELDDRGGVTLTVDLEQPIVGYKCRPHGGTVLDFRSTDHDPLEFFEPIPRPKNGHVILRRDEFFILSTFECIRVPPAFACEMVAYDTSKGEFRSHYAGFIDPGFGYGRAGEIPAAPLVLEVLLQENDVILRHGQPVCQVAYERLSEPATRVYGTGAAGSHYALQRGPRLSKHFRTLPDPGTMMPNFAHPTRLRS
ncbi:2'-deoxycytidine 5'-triphosphate deaminase [Candidatus Uhrbacteria bacterium]|nr:2'-deoxycytidine 5'-triphosphate deaminase [Candidatus Uhrbacteria bacterium]